MILLIQEMLIGYNYNAKLWAHQRADNWRIPECRPVILAYALKVPFF